MTDKSLFIEEKLLNSVKKLLSGQVNELLEETEYPIPPIEFGSYRGGSAIVPVIVLSTCKRSEKERIIRRDAYSLTITFAVPEYRRESGTVTPTPHRFHGVERKSHLERGCQPGSADREKVYPVETSGNRGRVGSCFDLANNS
jgi:hypothetical protein